MVLSVYCQQIKFLDASKKTQIQLNNVYLNTKHV